MGFAFELASPVDRLSRCQKLATELCNGKASHIVGLSHDHRLSVVGLVNGTSTRTALVDCNSDTGSTPAGHKIVTVADSLGLESFTISQG
jgi:hypothetical protein